MILAAILIGATIAFALVLSAIVGGAIEEDREDMEEMEEQEKYLKEWRNKKIGKRR